MKLASFLSHGPLRTIVWRTLLVSVLPLLLLGVIVVQVSESVMTARFREETELAASIATDAVHEKQSLALRGAQLTAGLNTVRDLVQTRDVVGLEQYLVPLKPRLGVDEINISGMDGKIFASAQDETETLIDLGLASSQATQAWVIVDDPNDPGLTLRGAAIIRTVTGAPIGLVEIGVTLGPAFLNSVKGSSGIDLVMMTDEGIRTSTLNKPLSGMPRLADIPAPIDQTLSAIVTSGSSKWAGSFNQLDSRGVPAALGVLVSREPLEAATMNILKIVGALCVALTVAVVAMSYRIGLTITTPLQRLTETAAKIQAGDLGARVERISSNELRDLEVGFNGMADSLEHFSNHMGTLVSERTERLAALHALSSVLGEASSIDELPTLLSLAADTTRRVSGVDKSAVLELLPEGMIRVREAGDLHRPAAVREVLLDLDTPAARTLRTGEPLVIDDVASYPELKLVLWSEMVSSVSVLVPGADAPFGVLVAQSGAPHNFDNDELEFIQSVANTLGQTIERVRAVDNLRDEHARTEHLLASIPSMLIGVDVNGSIQLWNRASEEALELLGADVLRHTLTEMSLGWRQDEIDVAAQVAAKEGRAVQLDEMRYVRPSGVERFLSLTVTPVLDDEKTLTGYLLIGLDVTERRTLQDQLNQAQRLEAIGRLAAGIAHEINTPTQYVGDNVRFLADAFRDLNGLIATQSELIAGVGSEDLTEQAEAAATAVDIEFLATEVPEAITQSLDGIERITSIVMAMKEFSHPGSADFTPTDLNHSLETTIAVSRNEWKYVADVITDFDDTLPAVPCLPGQLNQAFLNIVVNAAHAIGDKVEAKVLTRGTITVRTRQIDGIAEITITDNGGGIPESIRGQIFDPFFTTKAVGRGTGQGLAIARSIVVEKHNGEIVCESTPGEGTSFFIRLPLEVQAREDTAA